jgi:hypothetical protein
MGSIKIYLTSQNSLHGTAYGGVVRRYSRHGYASRIGASAVGLFVAAVVTIVAPGSGALAAAVHQSAAHRGTGSVLRAAAPGHPTAVSGTSAAAPASTRPAVSPPIVCTDSWKKAQSGDWDTAADWSTGSVPTSSDNACITKPGTYTVTLTGNGPAGTLTLGGSSGTQTLTVEANASYSALALSTATGSEIKAHGVFVLDSEPVSGAYSAYLNGGASVTLTNDGLFETLGATTSNPDFISADVTNEKGGTVSIAGASTEQNANTTIANSGSFTVTSTGNLAVDGNGGNEAFTQSGGTLDNKGTITVSDATFTQSGGTDSGNTVALDGDCSLNDSAGSGTFGFAMTGSDSLSGTIPAGQTITVVGGAGNANGQVALTGNVTNKGTFALDSLPVSAAGSAYLNGGTSVTLTNDGTFETLGATIGTATDFISADVTNEKGAAVSIAGASTEQNANTTFTNGGSLTVTSTGNLAVDGNGGNEAFTQSGGTLDNKGTITVSDATFTQSGGTDSGNTVLLTEYSTLTDSAGRGNFTLVQGVYLSGTIPNGQTVTVLTNHKYNPGSGAYGMLSEALLTGDVTNHGTFVLRCEVAGYQAELYDYEDQATGTVATFTNDGTFEAAGVSQVDDILDAPLINNSDGTVSISANTETGQDAPITNSGAWTVTPTGYLTVIGVCGAACGTPPPPQTSFTNTGTVDNMGTISMEEAVFSNSGVYEATFGSSQDTSALVGASPSGDTGYIDLGGTLEIDTVGSPATGTTFNVVGNNATSTDVSGTFATYNFGSENYTVNYGPNGVTATVAASS